MHFEINLLGNRACNRVDLRNLSFLCGFLLSCTMAEAGSGGPDSQPATTSFPPLNPIIDESRTIVGPKSAKITIVEYGDFQCPYCGRSHVVMKRLLKKYNNSIRYLFKDLPLDFHPMARPAALYYEAIGLQNKRAAAKFHDVVLENQRQLNMDGKKYLETTASKLGIDMEKLKADMEDQKIQEIIVRDSEEGQSFGITGTPGFVVNGTLIAGAYPIETFIAVIDPILKNHSKLK